MEEGDGIVDGDADHDGGDHGAPDVEAQPRESHRAEHDYDREDGRNQRREPERKRSQGEADEDEDEGEGGGEASELGCLDVVDPVNTERMGASCLDSSSFRQMSCCAGLDQAE